MNAKKLAPRKFTTILFAVATLMGMSFASVVVADSFSDAVNADNPLAYYRFGEASGTMAADETGNHPGTYVGSPTLGIAGSLSDTAAQFDGVDDFVQAPSLSTLGSSLGNFSIETIFGINGTSIGSVTSSFSSTIGNTGYGLRVNSDTGSTLFIVRGGTGAFVQGTVASGIGAGIYDGGFHHVVMTYDAGGLKAYFDGQAQTLVLSGGTPTGFADLDQGVGIGATQQSSSAANFFSGRIDEMAFYGSALTQQQVSDHFAATSVPEPSCLFLLMIGSSSLALRRRKRLTKKPNLACTHGCD